MNTDDVRSRWALRGDPALLDEAAAALRSSRAEQIFGTRFPGEYVMSGVARLLESLAGEIRRKDDAVAHSVISAATDLSGHVLRYLPELGEETPAHGSSG
jgi:hypothetical protein